MAEQKIEKMKRYFGRATRDDQEELGPLGLLPGTWANEPDLRGRGWNLIALPFATPPGGGFNYRVLMNQYNETLTFSLVDKGVPNRGIDRQNGATVQTDQFVVTLDYQQSITQIAAADSPDSGQAGDPGLAIHHEPGLWLHMLNERTDGLDIGRLATIPHGDSVLALGRSAVAEGGPEIPEQVDALPIGVPRDPDGNPYLAPYKHFIDAPFKGEVGGAFPGFSPADPTHLLRLASEGLDVRRTTTLFVDSEIETGGVVNIPFIVKQANAASMTSTFWILELNETDEEGRPVVLLQYLQVVILDFFPRRDGHPGLIRWPHISINTLRRVAGPETT